MLVLTTAPPECFVPPIRVPVGGPLCAVVPAGPGIVADRWLAAAECAAQQLEDLANSEGAALEYGEVPQGVLVRVVGARFPATTLLTHPRLAGYVRDTLTLHFGQPPVVYVCPREPQGAIGSTGTLRRAPGAGQGTRRTRTPPAAPAASSTARATASPSSPEAPVAAASDSGGAPGHKAGAGPAGGGGAAHALGPLILARPHDRAVELPGWLGPYELGTGYCLPVPLE